MIIWGLTEGAAGMVSQVRGVGEALAKKLGKTNPDVRFELKQARRFWPWSLLPASIWRGSLWLKTPSSDALRPPWPDVLITSGRRSAAFAFAIKQASGGKTVLIHLQTPRAPMHLFDLVVPMEHDEISADNIFPTFAALHHITPEKLSFAAYEWSDKLAQYPHPQMAFLIGGSTNKYTLNASRAKQLIAEISTHITQHTGSVFLSTSRRTSNEVTEMLQCSISQHPRSWVYTAQGENPYLAWLASADILVVTNDSVSMMSEALATGKPLYIMSLPGHIHTKPARFARQLIARGLARPLTYPLTPYRPVMYSECPAVVDEIIRLLRTHAANPDAPAAARLAN